MTSIKWFETPKYGINGPEALGRLMNNEALYIKFLQKFTETEYLQQLHNALKYKNAEAAVREAHSLKGICMNLGLDGILEVLLPIYEKLRSGNLDITDEEMQSLDERYKETCCLIQKIADGDVDW